jgi:apolipoprotein N-acyltransferase
LSLLPLLFFGVFFTSFLVLIFKYWFVLICVKLLEKHSIILIVVTILLILWCLYFSLVWREFLYILRAV